MKDESAANKSQKYMLSEVHTSLYIGANRYVYVLLRPREYINVFLILKEKYL